MWPHITTFARAINRLVDEVLSDTLRLCNVVSCPMWLLNTDCIDFLQVPRKNSPQCGRVHVIHSLRLGAIVWWLPALSYRDGVQLPLTHTFHRARSPTMGIRHSAHLAKMEAGTGISITLFRSRSEEILEHSIETSIPFLPSLLETCHRFPLLVLLLLVFAHTAGPTGTSHPNPRSVPNPNPNPKVPLPLQEVVKHFRMR